MKIALLVIFSLIIIGGGAFAAASLGFVHVPGISPIDFGKPILASRDERRGWIDALSAPLQALNHRTEEDAATVKKPPAPSPTVDIPKIDPSIGDEKIAEFWNGLEPKKLASITADWPERNLARILLKMDPDQVTDYLAELPTPRAAKISQAIQQLASLPPPSDTTST